MRNACTRCHNELAYNEWLIGKREQIFQKTGTIFKTPVVKYSAALCESCLKLIAPRLLIPKPVKTSNTTINYGFDYALNKPYFSQPPKTPWLSGLLKHFINIAPSKKLLELYSRYIPKSELRLQDPKFSQDPRPLESLEDAINPGFDEDGRMLTHPLPPQHPRFTQPDRQLSESAYVKSSKIMYPHLATSSVPKHLRVVTIMAKAKCSSDEARIISDECISLNATEAMVNKFCSWARRKGSDKLIDYLLPFTETVVDVEIPDQETEPWEENPVEAGKPLWGNTIDNIRGYNGICEDVPVEMIGLPEKSTGPLATMIDGELTWDNPTDDEEDWEAQMAEWEPEDRNPNNGSIIAYHVLEDFNAEKEKPWIDRQPKWFIQKLNTIQNCRTIADLTELGQTIHESNNFNRDQAGVFWTEYHSQKHKLEPKYLGLTARSFLKKIIQSNGHIGALGVFLHNVQSGKIKVTPDPTKHEWGVIWETYKRRKEVHATA